MPLCPHCQHDIPPEDVNVAKDTAYCRACDTAHSLAAIVHGGPPPDPPPDQSPGEAPAVPPPFPSVFVPGAVPEADLANPPPGCWYRDEGAEAEAGGTTRSSGAALVFAAIFWNTITWILIGAFVGSGAIADSWFMILFFVPFVAIGALFAWMALLSRVGVCRVRMGTERVHVSVGVGNMGWKKQFAPASVTKIGVEPSNTTVNGRRLNHICVRLEGGDTVTFGSGLTDERQAFVAGAMKKVLGV